MPRGPYKKYLHRYGNGVIPRSTLYRQLKRLSENLANGIIDIPTGEIPIINEAERQNSQMSGAEFDSRLHDTSNGMNQNYENSWVNHENHELFGEQESSWLYEDYDEEVQEQEIWFDAEESPSIERLHESINEEPNEDQHEESWAEDMYNQPLCACTSITRGEALLMTLLLGLEESLTWKTITAILSLINTLFRKKVVLDSKYKLFKKLQLNDGIVVYHLFCNNCMFYFGVRNNFDTRGLICEGCRELQEPPNISFFLTLDMKPQLIRILQDPEVQLVLLEHFESPENSSDSSTIEDITDGKIYKKISAAATVLADGYNLTYTFNTDGCKKSKSSKVSTWPIFVVINELPIKLQKKHMIMPGIWVGDKEPYMQLFLKPFVDQANKLSDEGIEWTLDNRTITSKFIPICAVVDSIARPKVLNMKQFNGVYGCTFCEHPTESVNGSRKYTLSTIVPNDRTDASIKESMVLAAQSAYGTSVMGAWGPSVLMNLDYFDIADGMSPDYMHAVLLGTVKQHTNILLSSFGREYYIGSPNELEVINATLTSFKNPSCITRSPRDIKERDLWKANEWRSWLLFYALICLKRILPVKYLNHLALLVEALDIMLSEKIDAEELRVAGYLLIKYVVLYQEYFGKDAMTYNIHLLLHMERSVSNLGPLWSHNTFIFENENHFILKMQKSPTHLALQIARRYIFEKSLPSLSKTLKISDEFDIFCEKHFTGRLKTTYKVNGCTLIGNGKDYTLNALEQKLLNTSKKCRSFNRCIYKNNRYTSSDYRLCQKVNNSLIMLEDEKIGIIKNICCFDVNRTDKEIYIFYEEIIRLRQYFHQTCEVTVHSIEICAVTKNLRLCRPEKIIQPCILTQVQGQFYIIKIPKGCFNND